MINSILHNQALNYVRSWFISKAQFLMMLSNFVVGFTLLGMQQTGKPLSCDHSLASTTDVEGD
jgi:hypothetical protein